MRITRRFQGLVTVALFLCAGCGGTAETWGTDSDPGDVVQISSANTVDTACVRLSRSVNTATSDLRSTTAPAFQEFSRTVSSGYSFVRGRVLAFVAILLGGPSVPINQTLHESPAIGIYWFLLDLLLMALLYVPIELLWPQRPDQGRFRPEWTLDVAYFLSTHLPVQVMSLLIWWPATEVNRLLGNAALQGFVGGLPWLVQFGLAVLVADLAEYAAHRLLHRVPFLWRFHAVHHSVKALDWIAGSRAHFVDDLIVRGAVLLPIVVLGFSQAVIAAYLVFATLHATWTHCNFGPTSEWLEKVLVLPRHHHWHHASEKEAIDKNYAIHFPWIDRIFGTYYSPKGLWPDRYGLDGEELAPSFIGQTIGPFLGK